MDTLGDLHEVIDSAPTSLKMHEDIVPHGLLDESSAFLEALRYSITTGEVRVLCGDILSRFEQTSLLGRDDAQVHINGAWEYTGEEFVYTKQSAL